MAVDLVLVKHFSHRIIRVLLFIKPFILCNVCLRVYGNLNINKTDFETRAQHWDIWVVNDDDGPHLSIYMILFK